MQAAVVVDIGSTFTKAALVNLSCGTLLARAQVPTTVQSGVQHGLRQAEQSLLAQAQVSEVRLRLASSSAAGGLRMVTSGLVPELTAEAARLAALGAGARVLRVYSYKLTTADVTSIAAQRPDVILLSGGADGGDFETALHNAQALTQLFIRPPVIYAGNKNIADEVQSILSAAGFPTHVAQNVMPRLGVLQVDSARAAIRQVFFENIIVSKGLEHVRGWANKEVVPTPAAVQSGVVVAARALCVDKLMTFDIGGATTDVYSIGGSEPQTGAHLQGLPMPHKMRTVEGDLGLRVSLESLLAALPAHELSSWGITQSQVEPLLQQVEANNATVLPEELDIALARICVSLSAGRHAGTMELLPTPMGYTGIQRGKDLTGVNCVIGTGGVLSHSQSYGEILSACVASHRTPLSLLPRKINPLQDKDYILYAAGLLAEDYPEAAAELVRASLS